MDFLEYPEAFREEKGAMNPGRLKLTNQSVIFKNSKTGKVDQIQGSDIESVQWQRIAATFGLRLFTKNGLLYRFGGFSENDHDKLSKFFSVNFDAEMKNRDMCLKGWNWGIAKFQGSVLSFDVDKSAAFEIPLGNVSHCVAAKNEVTMEFHQNDEAAVSLMELRYHIPTDANSETDAVQAFVDNVLANASIIQATGDAIVTFKELQCLTPRGRYDIKIFPSFIQLHGKTFDYKIPLTTVLRLFLLPHKDGRQMFFVLSLDPPIKHGQTRYHFLILLFSKEEETTIELRLSESEIKEKYEDKLQKEMSGPTFEVISRVMKALVQRKINIPGSFKGHSGTQAIACSYRAGNGLLYPLERGLIYVHKPAVHIRFDEVGSVNFARSGGSTRSFDFEIETKNGVVHTFSSIEKEEYTRLYDFVSTKHLSIKNRNTGLTSSKKKPKYNEDEIVDSDVEDEPDAYLQRVKAEGREREEGGGSTDEESSDESFAPEESGSEVAEEYDSNPPTSSDSDDDEGKGSGSDDSSGAERKPKEKKDKPKKSRSAKTVKEPGMRKKRQKKERDENKPKRPASAFFMYLGEMREKIKNDNPGIAITELTKKAGEMWKEVSDKSKWEEKSAEAKREYEVKMAEYKATGGGGDTPKSKPSKSSSEKKRSPSKTPTKSPGSFKSKEYVSSSGSSSDSDAKPKSKKGKSKSKEEKMEVDDDDEVVASSAASSAEGSD